MSFNGLGTEGALGLAAALKKNRTLQELDISHNRIMDMDAVAIGHGLGVNDALRVLRVSVCIYLTTG